MTEDERNRADPWLTLAEIAEELRVNPATVRLWVSKGQLKASRAGVRKWIVRRSDLVAMLAETNPTADEILDRFENPESSLPSRREPERTRAGEADLSLVTPAGTRESVMNQIRSADVVLNSAYAESDYAPPSVGYVNRLTAIADGFEQMASTLIHAGRTTGITWAGKADFVWDTLPYELRPDGNRPTREGLWDRFDKAVVTLNLIREGHDMVAVGEGFRELGAALLAVADELEGYQGGQVDASVA